MSTGPESTALTRKLEDEALAWSNALEPARRVESLVELEDLYSKSLGRKVAISQVFKRHPVFTGMTKLRNDLNEREENLGYACSPCKSTYAGKPSIVPSDIQGYINFDCGVCRTTLDSREVEPTKRTC